MPAVSKKQAVAMNIAKAVQQGKATAKPGSPSADIAGSMKPSDLNDFAGTPQAGLPTRAPITRAKGGPVRGFAPPAPAPVAAPVPIPGPTPAAPGGPPMRNVGGPGPGRPSAGVTMVGRPIQKIPM